MSNPSENSGRAPTQSAESANQIGTNGPDRPPVRDDFLPLDISDIPDVGHANTLAEFWEWCSTHHGWVKGLRAQFNSGRRVRGYNWRVLIEIYYQCYVLLRNFGWQAPEGFPRAKSLIGRRIKTKRPNKFYDTPGNAFDFFAAQAAAGPSDDPNPKGGLRDIFKDIRQQRIDEAKEDADERKARDVRKDHANDVYKMIDTVERFLCDAMQWANAKAGPAAPPVNWTRADGPRQWAKLFGISATTFKRRCKEGKIRHRKLSPKSYQVVIDDLPAKDQAKFGNPTK